VCCRASIASIGIPQKARIVVDGLAINQLAVTVVEIVRPTLAGAGIEPFEPDAVIHFDARRGRLGLSLF
jgi:hypothetical protein